MLHKCECSVQSNGRDAAPSCAQYEQKENMLRDHYIKIGAIRPDQPTEWTSKKPTLNLDQEGRDRAQVHIYEHEYVRFTGEGACEIPQEQVPDYVLAYWGVE